MVARNDTTATNRIRPDDFALAPRTGSVDSEVAGSPRRGATGSPAHVRKTRSHRAAEGDHGPGRRAALGEGHGGGGGPTAVSGSATPASPLRAAGGPSSERRRPAYAAPAPKRRQGGRGPRGSCPGYAPPFDGGPWDPDGMGEGSLSPERRTSPYAFQRL